MHDEVRAGLGGVEPLDDLGVVAAVAADDRVGVVGGDVGDFEAGAKLVVAGLAGRAVAGR